MFAITAKIEYANVTVVLKETKTSIVSCADAIVCEFKVGDEGIQHAATVFSS